MGTFWDYYNQEKKKEEIMKLYGIGYNKKAPIWMKKSVKYRIKNRKELGYACVRFNELKGE